MYHWGAVLSQQFPSNCCALGLTAWADAAVSLVLDVYSLKPISDSCK